MQQTAAVCVFLCHSETYGCLAIAITHDLMSLKCLFFYLLKFINKTKNIHTVNAVKHAENRLVEWPTQLCVTYRLRAKKRL